MNRVCELVGGSYLRLRSFVMAEQTGLLVGRREVHPALGSTASGDVAWCWGEGLRTISADRRALDKSTTVYLLRHIPTISNIEIDKQKKIICTFDVRDYLQH
jgi:hypothetical protein